MVTVGANLAPSIGCLRPSVFQTPAITAVLMRLRSDGRVIGQAADSPWLIVAPTYFAPLIQYGALSITTSALY